MQLAKPIDLAMGAEQQLVVGDGSWQCLTGKIEEVREKEEKKYEAGFLGRDNKSLFTISVGRR